MSVATLLTQPRLVEKLASNESPESIETLAEDIVVLLRRILANPEKSEAILKAFSNGFERFGNDFINNAPDLNGGVQQLSRLVNPLVEELKSFAGAFNDLAGAIEFIADKFVSLMDKVANLSINDIRSFINQLLTILENKFGFSINAMLPRLWELLDTVSAEIKNIPAEADREERDLRLVTAALLGRLKRELQQVASIPAYTNNDLADTLMKILREMGLDGWMRDAGKIAETIKAVFTAAGSIDDIIRAAAGSSLGAAVKNPESGDTYCWYASWLLQSRKRDFLEIVLNYLMLDPSDEVWITADKTQVVWRTVHGDDVVLHEGTNVKWTDAPMFSTETGAEYVLFKHVPADALEIIAHLSYAFMEFGKCIWNSVDAAETGDHATAATHAIWNAFNSFFCGIAQKPFISFLVQAAGWGQGHQGWMNLIFPILGTLLPSLEGRHTNADKAAGYWLVLAADDTLERLGHHVMLGMVRDVVLSCFTLINNIGGAQGNDNSYPINKEYTSFLAGVGGYVGQIIFLKYFYDKNDYRHLFYGFLWSFAGALAGLCGGLVGTCLGSAFAWGFNVKNFFIDIGVETAKGFFLYYPNAYSWIENDTEDGKFNGNNDQFAGYPDKSDSPYKLPYASGETQMCVQGHQGMFSHFAASNQIYAVDFGFDQEELVRAVRPGTVVGFGEAVDNDTHDSGWNYIIIRHDQAESTSVRDNHDKYHDNNTYITYAIYGHGRKNGVTEAFHERGETGSPLHKVVQQGDAIMKAGNTGISFHNHLHLHIKTRFEAHAGAPAGNTITISSSDFTSDTMPFVFADVPDNGVVKSLTFYTSTNGSV